MPEDVLRLVRRMARRLWPRAESRPSRFQNHIHDDKARTNKMRDYVTMERSPSADIVTTIGRLTAYGVDGVDWLVFVIVFQRGLV